MEGFNFGVPAVFVSYATILAGGIFVVIGWCLVLCMYAKRKEWRAPTALYTLTGSVAIELAGLIVLSYLPYGISEKKLLIWNRLSFIWSVFLAASVVLALISLLQVSSDRSAARHSTRMGAIVLLVVSSIGLVWYLA